MIQVRRFAPWVFLLATLVACGREDVPAGPHVIVRTFSVDGSAPEGLVARWQGAGGKPASFPLRPVPGGRPGEYVAVGAPKGSYLVEGSGGWSTLTGGALPPVLDPRGPTPTVTLGHPRTLYVLPPRSGVHPGTTWVAQRMDGREGIGEPVVPEVRVEPPGWVAVLRFSGAAWVPGTLLAVYGRYVRGAPSTPADASSPGLLVDPIRFRVPEGEVVFEQGEDRIGATS
ncbi:MAG: hypothetical protein ACC662_08705, partial [Planctomycetota bacterium]